MKTNESLATRKQSVAMRKPDSLAARLRRVVDEYPISARQWSVAAGKSSSQVGVLIKRHRENANAKFEEDTVRALARAVGCTFEWLAHGEGEFTLNRETKEAVLATAPTRHVLSAARRSGSRLAPAPVSADRDARSERVMRALAEDQLDALDLVLTLHPDRFDKKLIDVAIAQRDRFAQLSPPRLLAKLIDLHTFADKAREEADKAREELITSELEKGLR